MTPTCQPVLIAVKYRVTAGDKSYPLSCHSRELARKGYLGPWGV